LLFYTPCAATAFRSARRALSTARAFAVITVQILVPHLQEFLYLRVERIVIAMTPPTAPKDNWLDLP
jgi:hypothetical protein